MIHVPNFVQKIHRQVTCEGARTRAHTSYSRVTQGSRPFYPSPNGQRIAILLSLIRLIALSPNSGPIFSQSVNQFSPCPSYPLGNIS